MASQPAHALVAAVAAEIMAHLARHPAAADTPSGIRQWWLKRTRDHASPAIVEAALACLLAAGSIGVRRLPRGEPIYFGPGRRPPSGSKE